MCMNMSHYTTLGSISIGTSEGRGTALLRISSHPCLCSFPFPTYYSHPCTAYPIPILLFPCTAYVHSHSHPIIPMHCLCSFPFPSSYFHAASVLLFPCCFCPLIPMLLLSSYSHAASVLLFPCCFCSFPSSYSHAASVHSHPLIPMLLLSSYSHAASVLLFPCCFCSFPSSYSHAASIHSHFHPLVCPFPCTAYLSHCLSHSQPLPRNVLNSPVLMLHSYILLLICRVPNQALEPLSQHKRSRWSIYYSGYTLSVYDESLQAEKSLQSLVLSNQTLLNY